jgi:pilus assembly protein TadC
MITGQEKLFIDYWEANRERQKKLFYQLAIGLPLGLVFALPVLLAVIFHDWYKRMIFISSSQVTIILITVLGIAVFFALFRMKFKWEENEQRYKELKFKQSKTEPPSL